MAIGFFTLFHRSFCDDHVYFPNELARFQWATKRAKCL